MTPSRERLTNYPAIEPREILKADKKKIEVRVPIGHDEAASHVSSSREAAKNGQKIT